jgi:hypothetical protein
MEVYEREMTFMEKEIKIIYDESAGDSMYPLPDESNEAYEKRMESLRRKREAVMTPSNKRVAELPVKPNKTDAEHEELKMLIT